MINYANAPHEAELPLKSSNYKPWIHIIIITTVYSRKPLDAKLIYGYNRTGLNRKKPVCKTDHFDNIYEKTCMTGQSRTNGISRTAIT